MYNKKPHKKEEFFMQISKRLKDQAMLVAAAVEQGTQTLPAEIPGFPKLFLAKSDDQAIKTIWGITSPAGVSYKIGAK